MGIRGKTSGAELSVVQPEAITSIRRPDPLPELNVAQKEVWYATVNALPADWIRGEALDLLGAYCRHVVGMRKIADLISAEETSAEFDLQRYDKLLAMQEREGRAMSSLATRLRLTPQSTYDKTKTKRNTVKKPW